MGERASVIHPFAASLQLSHEHADAPWWEEIYREAFPAFAGMTYVGDSPAQRDGVDRIVTTTNGHIYRIDEKVRAKDYDDFFLEYWSVTREKKRGWIAKDLACDFIAYAFIPSRRCYLLPFPSLRRAWRLNCAGWVKRYGALEARNSGYVTTGTAVPISVVLDALRDALLVTWSDE